ncbi:MAG: DNA repair protein RecN [Erysipelotrichales bacterium]|nr:DNA repair protein RecN [Erysipelotrichales bacterium]
MLKSLYISSFVIIDELRVDFDEGMTVLTGETGAGKSIVIDALGQLCGQRASSSFVRKGENKAIIEGIFDVVETQELIDLCNELHIEYDEQFVISKEILNTGKSNIKINYQNASNSALKQIMPYMIDIHSQFETQRLFEEKNHIKMLDEYAGYELQSHIHEYQNLYKDYKELTSLLNKTIDEDMSDEQLEFLQTQLNEIDECSYTDEEVDDLETELKTLQNFEKLNENIQSFDQIMNSSQGVLSQMKEALYYLQNVVEYGDFQESYEAMYDEYYNFMDHYETVMDIYRSFHFDEYRRNEIQDIIFNINRIKRKYGFTMERVQEYRDELVEKINRISHREEYIVELQKKIKEKKEQCLNIAQNIHTIRKRNAKNFEKNIENELKDLYLEKAIFKVQFEKTDLQTNGIDKVKFMVAMNQGQDLSLLNESASGGEISRIMLAIKMIILSHSSIETVIFDEVDTGVSGKVASGIGEKMQKLALKKQVLCITHLPQVASLAHHHFAIEKDVDEKETVSSMRLLKADERIVEIAKMLSSEKITNEAIENAKKLLNV